jgi:hypothetical protein
LWDSRLKHINYITFPAVSYGSEFFSLTLRGEHRLRVFENRVLRRGPKRDEIRGGWRKKSS